ncbi:Outer membrane protein (OmpH-like) [Planctomycetes bacterium Pan216]|uniref:Outer membrane protein (OmpH-like) n=1 Tax=Kolteria novifilia TaxID=2527975 RepID=A0A518B446_9BACT|nr:Outer membrane protein (OmpH-like) [Planctomycetes bacterium Pan216]
MKWNHLWAGAAMVAGAVFVAGTMMQPAQAQQFQGIRIAVIDVNQVFKDYEHYKALTEDLKGQIQNKDHELRTIQQEIRAMESQLVQLKGAGDREGIERQLHEKTFEFKKLGQKYQQEMVLREASVYSTCYKEMTDLLTRYCDEHGIHIVLRLREESESENPQMVLQTIQRQVVHHHKNLDLTGVITQGLNAQYAQAR